MNNFNDILKEESEKVIDKYSNLSFEELKVALFKSLIAFMFSEIAENVNERMKNKQSGT